MKWIEDFARRHAIFYGWFSMAGGILILFVVGGSFVNSFGVFLPVICKDFGWSRATVAASLSLGVLAFGLPSPLFGILVTRLGPRRASIAGNLMAVVGFIALSAARSVWHFYALYIFIGLGAGLGGYIASATVVNNWFIRKRALAMGLFVAGMGLAGFVFPPLTTLLISSVGWRHTWLILAGLALIISVFLGSIVLMRNKPEEMGELPDGIARQNPPEVKCPARPSSRKDQGIPQPQRHALMQTTTWLIGLFVAGNAFASGTVNAHQIAYLQDVGFTPITAATTISIMAVGNVIGSLGFGTLAMRYPVKSLAKIAFVLQLIALCLLITTHKLWVIYAYALCMGLSVGALIAALPIFAGVYYNRENYSRMLGVLFPFQLISQALAATLAGIVHDVTSAYTLAFTIAAIMSLSGLIGVSCVRTNRP